MNGKMLLAIFSIVLLQQSCSLAGLLNPSDVSLNLPGKWFISEREMPKTNSNMISGLIVEYTLDSPIKYVITLDNINSNFTMNSNINNIDYPLYNGKFSIFEVVNISTDYYQNEYTNINSYLRIISANITNDSGSGINIFYLDTYLHFSIYAINGSQIIFDYCVTYSNFIKYNNLITNFNNQTNDQIMFGPRNDPMDIFNINGTNIRTTIKKI